jgi:hypothetical protein
MACELTTPSPSATKPETQPPASVENQTPPEVSPPAEAMDEAKWRAVQIFTGKESETTPPFHISGTEWRIIWTADVQSPEHAVFDILVYSQDKAGMLTKRISYSKGIPSDTVYIYEGGGDYYLKVIAANLNNWTVTLEDHGTQESTSPVQITKINYKGNNSAIIAAGSTCSIMVESDEYAEIKNQSDSPQNISGWVLKNLTRGEPAFIFPIFQPCSCDWYDGPEECLENCYPPRPCVIEPHKSIRVYTGEAEHYESGGFCFYYPRGDIWNNETPDTAVLYNLEGQEVSRKSYVILTKDSVASDK